MIGKFRQLSRSPKPGFKFISVYLRIILICFLVFLGGCTAFKKRQNAPTVKQEINLKSSIDQALSCSDFESGDWPAYNWWEMFNDPQLNQFIECAIQDSPDLQVAVSRWRSSIQQARKVRSKLMPDLDAGWQNNYEHLSKNGLFRFPPSTIPAVVNLVDLQLNFDYEIDLFGKNRETYRAAIGEAKANQAEMSESYLILTTSLTEAYFDFYALLLRIEAQEDLVETSQKLFELTKARYRNKLENEITLEEVHAKFLESKEELVNLQKEKELTQSQIKILMGKSPDDVLIFENPAICFDRPFPLPRILPLDLLARRPDLMAQIWKVESAAHTIGVARAAFLPNINLSAGAGFKTLDWGSLLSLSSFAGSLAPAIHLPIFTGWRLTAELEKSYADFDAEVFSYNQLILHAAKEVSDYLKILQATNERDRLQQDTVLKFIKINELTSARYQNGIDDYLRVLESKRNVLSQVMKQIEIQNRRHLAILNLIRSLGGGYDQQEEVKIP